MRLERDQSRSATQVAGRKVSLICLVLVLASVGASATSPGKSRGQGRNIATVFGIRLSTPIRTLLRNLSLEFGKEVKFEIVSDDASNVSKACGAGWTSSNAAVSCVDDNGIPRVFINKSLGMNQVTIAHELLHLEDVYSGMPAIELFGEDTDGLVVRSVSRIYDSLWHISIFRKLRRMGFDPESILRSSAEDMISYSGNYKVGRFTTYFLAMEYFMLHSQITDPNLISRIDRHFSLKASDSLRIGRDLVRFLAAHPILRDRQITESYIQLLQIAFDRHIIIERTTLRKIRKGKVAQNVLGVTFKWKD